MGRLSRQYVDTSGERPTVSFRIPDLTGDITADLASFNALMGSLDALTLLNPVKTDIVAQTTQHAGNRPANNLAQKEIAAIIHYHDSVNGRGYVYTIPGIDTTFLLPLSDEFDLTNATVAAFVTNFEAVVVSISGNPVVVDSITLKE